MVRCLFVITAVLVQTWLHLPTRSNADFVAPNLLQTCQACCDEAAVRFPGVGFAVNTCKVEGCDRPEDGSDTCAEIFTNGFNDPSRFGCELGRDFRLTGFSTLLDLNSANPQIRQCVNNVGDKIIDSGLSVPNPADFIRNDADCIVCCDAVNDARDQTPDDFTFNQCTANCANHVFCFELQDHRQRYACLLTLDWLLTGKTIQDFDVVTCDLGGTFTVLPLTDFPTSSPSLSPTFGPSISPTFNPTLSPVNLTDAPTVTIVLDVSLLDNPLAVGLISGSVAIVGVTVLGAVVVSRRRSLARKRLSRGILDLKGDDTKKDNNFGVITFPINGQALDDTSPLPVKQPPNVPLFPQLAMNRNPTGPLFNSSFPANANNNVQTVAAPPGMSDLDGSKKKHRKKKRKHRDASSHNVASDIADIGIQTPEQASLTTPRYQITSVDTTRFVRVGDTSHVSTLTTGTRANVMAYPGPAVAPKITRRFNPEELDF